MARIVKNYKGLEKKIGYNFKDISLVHRAMNHASSTGVEGQRGFENYERLEFLGDRVLDLVIAETLLDYYKNEKEGQIARRQTALVQEKALAKVALHIGLGDYINMSEGEARGGGRENPSILSDVCEALIAAIYRDGGLKAAAIFIRKHWKEMMESPPAPPIDAKSALQEWSQGNAIGLPEYRLLSEKGPSHAPSFEMEVSLPNGMKSVAIGKSKRIAAKEAARELMRLIKKEKTDG